MKTPRLSSSEAWRFGPDWPGRRCCAKTRRGTPCRGSPRFEGPPGASFTGRVGAHLLGPPMVPSNLDGTQRNALPVGVSSRRSYGSFIG